nr:hypothetical protein [Tanacetum cinerariifolium]
MTNYSLSEVILNGDSPIPTRVVDGVVQPIAPTTAEQRLAKKNELKARGTLLMALPDKHQLKFNIHKIAKSLMEAIEKRFGRNKETKKVQKTLLKQQYKNFTSSSSESLDQIHDRLQKLISQLEILVRVVTSVSAASTKVPVSALLNVDNLSDDVIYSFFASQSNSLRLDNDDLKQIDADDLEEMDLKWQMAMLTMRARKFLQRTRRNLGANGTTSIGFDISKVECYNYYKRGHFTRKCRSPRDTRNKDTKRRNVPVETSTSNALVSQCDGVGSYDWSFQADEEPTNYALMAFTSSSSSSSDNENENVFEEDIKLLKLDVMLRDIALVALRKKFEAAEKERDELKLTLENFQTSSKNLSKLLASQITDKTCLGYDNQMFNSTVFDSAELNSYELDVSMRTSLMHDSTTKPNKDLSQLNRSSAPIIEDWVSDSEDEYKGEPMPTQKAHSFVQTSEHVKTSMPSINPGNPRHALKDKEVIDSGCLRHMTGNISYLSDFEDINRGYVAFGGNPKGGKITGKGKIRTGKLDFNDVYFVKELKFNLFSLPDENHVLLRVPRENNMYNVDLNNIVPSGDLTCLFAQATLDESNLWHRRLGHINFKTMNKLVKGNIVRGLPSKVFENNHTCVACKKEKQHRASCKTKPVSSVSQPLQRLHMDLFGPTFVKSLNKKSYY